MAITASLGPGELPRVELILDGADLTASAPWSLTGSIASGFTWSPRGASGTGAGSQVVLVDTYAPVNEEITYSLTVSGAVVQTDTITRTYTGTGGDGLAWDAIANLRATSVAQVRRSAVDMRSSVRRFYASSVAGNRFAPTRRDPVSGAGGGKFAVATVGDETNSLSNPAGTGLLDSGSLVVVYHDTSRCTLPGCSVPPVDIVLVSDETSDVSDRVDIGERVWEITYLRQEDPDKDTLSPFQTWDDLDAATLTWDELDALAITWDEFDATTWADVG